MSNADDLYEDEEVEEPVAATDNKDAIIQRLQKKLEKQQAAFDKKLEGARTEVLAEVERKTKTVEMAGTLGLKPGLATRFLSENPDTEATAEALTGFAEELGVPVKTTESEEEAPAEKKPPAAAAFHAGVGTPSGGEFYSADEVRKIGLRDQAEALKIIAEDRMKTDT